MSPQPGSSLFQAYLDESGTHAGSPILAVAGFFGTAQQWTTFLENWTHNDFHAVDPRFSRLKEPLVTAIEIAQLQGVEVCLRPHEFENLANAGLKSSIGNAYAVAAFCCVSRICNLIESNPDARVAFVLEDGQPNVDWVRRLLISMIGEFPIASVTVAKKQDLPQLHPADLLAHSRSTSNTQWMELLFANQRVWEQRIEGDLLVSVSSGVNQIIAKNRQRKAQLRQASKNRVGGV